MSQDTPGRDRSGRRDVQVALIGAAGLVLVAIIGGVFTFLSRQGPSAPATPLPNPTSASPSPNPTTSSPIPPGTLGRAQIDSVTSPSGGSCIADTADVAINVSRQASADRELWLMAVVLTGIPKHSVYYAKQSLTNITGPQTVNIQFIGAAVGSTRDLVIVSGDHASSRWLNQNHANDGNPAWDIHRVRLRPGVAEISSRHKVTTQRC
jgi:hypothetical protein